MSKHVEFYFDVGSPTAYLAWRRLGQLREQYGLQLEYRPILLGGIFKATGNSSPVAIPAKGAYMLEHDLPRFAKRYGVELNFNPHFPINTLPLMRGAIAAQHQGCLELYLDAVFPAIWVDGRNMGDLDVIVEVLQLAGLDVDALLSGSQDPGVKQELIDVTEAAAARGVFGAPTLYLDGEMFFGQDRFDFVEERLTS